MLDDVQILERRKAANRNPALEQLDSLHTGADINKRLQLSEGKRLKLAAPKSSNKRKPAPNFDIELATLKRSQSPGTSNHILSDSQSDDDLVNISELLGHGKHVLSKTDYSNSEVNAPIRDDDNESAIYALSLTHTPTRKRAYDCGGPTTALPLKDSPSRNAGHRPYSPRGELVNDDRQQKRFKAGITLFGSPSDIRIKGVCR